MSTLTIRIDDNLKKSAFKAAEKLGIPLTLVIKNALKQFTENPNIVIGEPSDVIVNKNIKEKMNLITKKC